MSQLSLKDRLAAKRAEMEHREPIDLEIPGYEDVLIGRFHVLNFRKEADIEERVQNTKGVKTLGDQVLLTVADKLINACDTLLLIEDDGSLTDLNVTFNVATAQEIFGVDHLTPSSTARDAMLAIFPDENMLVKLYRKYEAEAESQSGSFKGEILGESRVTSEVA